MADRGTEMTDKRLEEIASRLRRIYTEAAEDLEVKFTEYTKGFIVTDKKKRADLANGKITQQEYKNWLSGQVFIGKQWQSKVDQMARSLVGVEENAVRLVRDGQLDAFADNTNFMEYQIDREIGFSGSFSLYDTNAVANLVLNEPELLRRRVVDGVKCEAWNQKIIANCITQGIIQGESIPQIAKRMARDTASTDMNAMYRYARTAMTGAQNAGRIQAMNNSIEQGIIVKKEWIATLDSRTRDAHADLDGEVVDVNEPFENDIGPIMYPGDPEADDENVWNCRCTLGFVYADSPSNGERYDQEYGEDIEDMDYDEWYEWRNGMDHNAVENKGFQLHQNDDTIDMERQMASKLRQPEIRQLTEREIESLKEDIDAIKADESIFRFNVPNKRTGYYDDIDIIVVNGSVLPSDDDSPFARDRMSSRAVLAHEYYGHRAHRRTRLLPGDWRDEFRASYMAALRSPGLSDEDRQLLMRDALDRADEAGIAIRLTPTIREVLYGISEDQ